MTPKPKQESKARLVGPTWWCPVKGATEEHSLARRHVDRGRKLYVPVDEAEDWCITGAPTRYGYARLLDGGFYAFVRTIRRPKLGVQAWLIKLTMLVEPEVIDGPYRNCVPDKAILHDIRTNRHDEDDLYFEATLQEGRLSVRSFSGRHMDALRAKAQAGPATA